MPALAAYVVVHACLLWHDAVSPAAFLAFDRAVTRMQKIDELLAARDGWVAPLIANSAPGDYLFHALCYGAAGRFGVIGVQLMLGVVGLVFTYRLARALLRSDKAAGSAALLYVFLPGSLWTPHVLSTEALIDPLLAVALYYGYLYFAGGGRWRSYLLGLLTLGIVIFIRPQFMAFPLVLAGCGAFRPKPYRWPAILLPAASFLPTVCWAGLLLGMTGSPLEQRSDHGLSATLQERVGRAEALGQFSANDTAPSLSSFLGIVRSHPVPILKTYLSDAVNFALNPGVSGLTNYLGWFADYPGDYWTRLRDRVGYLGIVSEILARDAGFAAIMFVGVTAWSLTLILMIAGCRPVFLDRHDAVLGRRMLLCFWLYSAAAVFAAGNVRWTHRAPLDFLIVSLVIAGALRIQRAWLPLSQPIEAAAAGTGRR